MRRILGFAIAVLLFVSVGINVAEAAEIVPCADTPAVSILAANSPVDIHQPDRSAPAMHVHCAAISPFSAAILAVLPVSPDAIAPAGLFLLPGDETGPDAVPLPMHGPPRA